MTPHGAFFLLAMALLFVHEMDAVRCHEWRILPVLSRLGERVAMLWFVWSHVPLFVIVIWAAARSINASGDLFSILFSAFCILHAFLHLAYERHPLNEFRNALSRSIIWSCAGAGLLAIVFAWSPA